MGYHQLTQGERYAIARMHARGYSDREIGYVLDRSPATIGRERKRNACPHDGFYRAEKAHSRAMTRRSKSRKKSQYSQGEWGQVRALLQRKWSPKQISGRRAIEGARAMSHETIYRYVRRDRREGGSVWRHMRVMSKIGRKHRGSPVTRGRLAGKRHISERPKAVQARRQLGHYEGDTVMGADVRHCVLTLVERKTGFVVIKKLSARSVEQANTALGRSIIGLKGRIRTITLDNGTEFHGYKRLEEQFRVKFYFATPYHSWERERTKTPTGCFGSTCPRACA